MASPVVLAGAAFASASVATVALLWAARHREARLVAAAVAIVLGAAWAALAAGSRGDPTRLRELTILAAAGGAPALATLLLTGGSDLWRRALAVGACVVAVPVLALGIAFFVRLAEPGAPMPLVLPALLVVHLAATLAAAARAVVPTRRAPSP